MKKGLVDSSIDRRNILNNSFAVLELQNQIGINGVLFDGEYRFTTQQVADFYEVSVRTVRRYLSQFGDELRESEKARVLRGLVLNLVINIVAKRAGGDTKFINQREDSYLLTMYAGEGYRKEFTGALDKYVALGPFKYTVYTNKIYISIFKEQFNTLVDDLIKYGELSEPSKVMIIDALPENLVQGQDIVAR